MKCMTADQKPTKQIKMSLLTYIWIEYIQNTTIKSWMDHNSWQSLLLKRKAKNMG